jgi:hypothetical protein
VVISELHGAVGMNDHQNEEPDPWAGMRPRRTTIPDKPIFCGEITLEAGTYAVVVDFKWNLERGEWVVSPKIMRRTSIDEEWAEANGE